VQKLLIAIIAVLSFSAAARAEPSQAIKDWLPQLDKNIEDINALMKAGARQPVTIAKATPSLSLTR
jgi:hypothetical protein